MECNKASITTRIEQLLAAESALLEQRDHALLNQTATAGTGSSSSSNRHCRRSSCSCSSCSSCCFNPTMLAWRGKVAQWFFDVADHFHERRSVVYVAMNILDRYCCSCYWTQQQEQKKKQANLSSVPAAVFMDAKKYELASMAALFIAFRMAKPSSGCSPAATKIRLSHLTSVSRGGRIQVRHVISMGADIIQSLASSLEHRVIPPLEFVTLYLQEEASFLPPPLPAAAAAASAASSSTAVPTGSSNDETILSSSSSSGILELATYLVEISIFDMVLSRCKASDIALAATLEAIDKQHGARSSSLESSLSALFLKKISTTRSSEETIASIRSRLQLLYRRSADHASAGRSPTRRRRRRRRRHSSSRHQNAAAAAAAACEHNLVTEDERDDDDDDEEEDHDDDAPISPRRQQQAIRSVPDNEEEEPSVILREQQLSSTGAWGRKRRRRVY